jgi:hypothetical protein
MAQAYQHHKPHNVKILTIINMIFTINITQLISHSVSLCQTPTVYEIKICDLMGYYAAYSGNSLPTFRTNLSRAKLRPIGKSVINHHYTPRNSPEKRTSHLLRGGSLKSCAVFTAVLQKWLIKKIINSDVHFFTSACEADLCRSCTTKESRKC